MMAEPRRSWTHPILYHAVQVSFEVVPGEPSSLVLPTRQSDVLGIGGSRTRGIEFRNGQLFARGRKLALREGSDPSLSIFLPLAEGETWLRKFADLTLRWKGRAGDYAIEQRTAERAVWFFARTRVELDSDGNVTLRSALDSRSYRTPCALTLDADGMPLEPVAGGGAR